MKLARKIAEELVGNGDVALVHHAFVEKIVAANLEHIRDVLVIVRDFIEDVDHGIFCDSRDNRECDCGLIESLKMIHDSLAMLSEEE